MKFSFIFSVFLFISINLTCQVTKKNDLLSFEELYKKATDDYENEVINSPYYDKALEACPDVKKYPKLLLYKGISLYQYGNDFLAIKYLEQAILYVSDVEDFFKAKNSIGFIYVDLGQNKKALTYFKEALIKAQEINDEFHINEIKFSILMLEYEYLDEKPTLNKFWNLYNNLDEDAKVEKFEYLNTFYEINNRIGFYDESKKIKEYINANIDLDTSDKCCVSLFYYNNADLELGLKNYKKALKHNDTSYAISKQFLGKLEVLNALLIYKETYENNNKLDIALQYADSIQLIDDEFKKVTIKSNLEIVNENILFNKVKEQTETKISNYKTIILFVSILVILILILFFIRRKKHQENLTQLSSDLRINKGKYNESLKDNIEFKKEIKELLKAKKFDEISKLYKKHEIEDINNETYITYLASDISPSFLKKLEKHTFTFSDIEKTLLYYRKNNHTNKEIALITNRSLRSVQSLFYRLNKKILLKTNLNIAKFLENL